MKAVNFVSYALITPYYRFKHRRGFPTCRPSLSTLSSFSQEVESQGNICSRVGRLHQIFAQLNSQRWKGHNPSEVICR